MDLVALKKHLVETYENEKALRYWRGSIKGKTEKKKNIYIYIYIYIYSCVFGFLVFCLSEPSQHHSNYFNSSLRLENA